MYRRDLDPWPDICPEPSELPRQSLLQFLNIATTVAPWLFTDWQRNFCRHASNLLTNGYKLSDYQLGVLETGLMDKLWTTDPMLWENLDEDVAGPQSAWNGFRNLGNPARVLATAMADYDE